MSRAVRNLTDLVVKTDRYSVILLASSFGSRMKSYGSRSLLPIDEKLYLIDKQIEYIRHVLPGVEIVLVAGFEAEKVMGKVPHGIIKVEHEGFTESETIRGLGIGLRAATKDHVVFLPGHIAFNKEVLKSVSSKSSIIICSEENDTLNIGCCVNDNIVENLHFDLPNKWSHIACFSGKELELLRGFCWNRMKDKLFLFEAINAVISKGGTFAATKTNGRVVVIESLAELDQIRKYKIFQ